MNLSKVSKEPVIMGPAWDNSSEYSTLTARELTRDFERGQELAGELATVTAKLAPLLLKAEALDDHEIEQAVLWAQTASRIFEDAVVLLRNVSVFADCELSVDGRNAAAKVLAAKVRSASARLARAYQPAQQFLTLTTDAVVERYLATPRTAPERHLISQNRKRKAYQLSLAEEDVVLGLAVDGPEAWGTLYENLSSAIECTLDLGDGRSRRLGLAEAQSLSQDPDDDVRRAAFRAVQKGWETHEESVAAILNALAGWRHEIYRRRSRQKPMGFLDEPLHHGRLRRETLEAMFSAVAEVGPIVQDGLRLQAQLLGKSRLDPWDLFAPCPIPRNEAGGASDKTPYDEAIKLIATAFGTVHPDMGAFVRMMAESRFIEGRVGPTKRPGAYCTKFPRSRTPRVYMTYAGGMRELKTLAHELGHAFHSWVMRDQPLVELNYPMTLAETASIFAETVVASALSTGARAPWDRLQAAWASVRDVESFCLNIPARFHFEKAFYERRLTAPLTPADFRQLMTESWATWYGDALSEMDPMFWASKLHFSISRLSFYNFPYTFGYLFVLGVYERRERLGEKFFQAYVDLLRDTGRQTVEDLASKHLGVDLSKPDFWRESLRVARRATAELEAVVEAVT